MLIDIDEIDSELLKKIEKNNPLSLPNEKIVIYNYQNKKIYSTDDESILEFPEERISRSVEKEIRFKQNEYEIYGQFYTGQFDRIVVFAAATDIFGINKLKWLRIIMFIVFVLSLVIVFFADDYLPSGHLLHFENCKQVNKIEASNLNERWKKETKKMKLPTWQNF